MKWAHTLAGRMARLPPELQAACISYKGWKKRTKDAQLGSECFVRLLSADCARSDRAFVRHERAVRAPPPAQPPLLLGLLLCKCLAAPPSEHARPCTRDDLRLFVELIRTTLHKICKRMDRMLAGRQQPVAAVRWLESARATHAFEFLSGWRSSALFLDLPAECPVCLEPAVRVAIADCGHHICFSCLFTMLRMRGRRGTLRNIVVDSETRNPSRCPVCRWPAPFKEFHVCPPLPPL